MRPNRAGGRSGIAAGLLAVAVAFFLSACDNSEAKNPPAPAHPKPMAVYTAVAQERRVPEALEVTGTLTADAQTDVASEATGRVTQVLVERGQVVAGGAVLARLDQEDALNQLREAEATEAQTRERLGLTNGQAFDPLTTPEVRQARVTMERMEVEYQRYARLVADGAVSRSEFDLKRADYLAQKEQLEAAVNQMRQLYQTLQAQRARVDLARRALADTVIRAPYGGLIAEKHVNVGQYLQRGSRVATLVRVDPLRVELAIPESAVAAVRKDQKVSFTVQTYPDRRFTGAIAYVGPALRADSRALIVEALVPNAGGALQPGLFATARIELPAARATVFVPAAAVRTEAGVSRLFAIKDARAELRFVQVGRQVEGQVEIVRGVGAGERIVTGPLEALADGLPLVADAQGGR
jgi:RND family efflux transporter MFP subunit